MREFFNLTLREMELALGALGNEKYRARQLFQWVYQKGVLDFHSMTNISKSLRNIFSEMFDMGLPAIEGEYSSSDGSTKFAFRTGDGKIIESVLIPENERNTLCVSSQIGCRMGCKFCVTGKIGFIRNLAVSEIIGQVLFVKNRLTDRRITNIVFMGMGEPMDNLENVLKAIEIMKNPIGLDFSRRRITISTVGLIDGLTMIEPGVAGIAISLNAADDETRSAIMPINRLYPIKEILRFVKGYALPNRERITFEYVMIKGVNDRLEDAKNLVQILKGVKCKVNLIPYNESPYIDFAAPNQERVEDFHRYLLERHFTAIVRDSRGRDVFGGCGQLGVQYLKEKDHERGSAGLR